ncbi:MAG: hypothetical protein A2428_17955 [Bdellovibrionales bacterium RIFOXYC1_FULL_54_43]|nr:MAG: hypothetical protein A2428_17955 [Bdellovibrionales bacterium RIFOXYC1_FULL_54_43]OFZ79706.1 MAG: hypothetical protein A2603_06145 [Bdellovibrionales bacterium RIFOXYD1_FULL_55_31]
MKTWIILIFAVFGGFGILPAVAQETNSLPVPQGIYHLNVEPTAHLSLNDDGTFFWNVCNGDYTESGEGLWIVEGGTIQLQSTSYDDDLSWPMYLSSGSKEVSSVSGEIGPEDGEITITGDASYPECVGCETLPFMQIWSEGRVCDIWLSPTALPPTRIGPVLVGQRPCDVPLVKDKACQGLITDAR